MHYDDDIDGLEYACETLASIEDNRIQRENSLYELFSKLKESKMNPLSKALMLI
jgi:hypothetical protein